ncbi:MAG: hypothetical protein FWJ93_13830 [Micromonosporaceae bacterium]
MVHVRPGLDRGQTSLGADGDQRGEGGARRHAGDVRMTQERITDIVAGPGGVMTDEVGVITGDLTLRTELAEDGAVTIRVQYREACEWYTVTGGRTTLADPADLDAVHAIAVGLLHRPEG